VSSISLFSWNRKISSAASCETWWPTKLIKTITLPLLWRQATSMSVRIPMEHFISRTFPRI